MCLYLCQKSPAIHRRNNYTSGFNHDGNFGGSSRLTLRNRKFLRWFTLPSSGYSYKGDAMTMAEKSFAGPFGERGTLPQCVTDVTQGIFQVPENESRSVSGTSPIAPETVTLSRLVADESIRSTFVTNTDVVKTETDVDLSYPQVWEVTC